MEPALLCEGNLKLLSLFHKSDRLQDASHIRAGEGEEVLHAFTSVLSKCLDTSVHTKKLNIKKNMNKRKHENCEDNSNKDVEGRLPEKRLKVDTRLYIGSAYLGLAGYYTLKPTNYHLALQGYCRALNHLGSSAPCAIRFMIGFCLYQLGFSRRAQQVFENARNVEPNNIEILCALASSIHQSAAASNYNICDSEVTAKIYEVYNRACEVDTTHPMLLLHLATLSFYAGNIEEAEKKILESLSKISPKYCQLNAESYFLLGRIAHMRGDHGKALTLYEKTLSYTDTHSPCEYHLAQIYAYIGKTIEAVIICEKLLTRFPMDFDINRLSAFVYAEMYQLIYRNSQKKKFTLKENIKTWSEYHLFALQRLDVINQEYSDKFNQDTQLLLLNIQLIENQINYGIINTNGKNKLLILYDQIIKNIDEKPLEILNNKAVLLMLLDQIPESKIIFEQVLENSVNLLNNTNLIIQKLRAKSIIVTARYNIANLLEISGDYKLAHLALKQISSAYPEYADVWKRRIALAIERNDLYSAQKYLTKANSFLTKSNDLTLFKANIARRQGHYTEALSYLKNLLLPNNNNYYVICYANALVEQGQRKSLSNQAAQAGECFSKAVEYYTQVLTGTTAGEGNIIAVNGLSMVLAHQNMLTGALTILKDAVESSNLSNFGSSAIYSAHLNLGILYALFAYLEKRDFLQSRIGTENLKVSKAIKHIKIAMYVRPLNIEPYFIMTRLLFDSKRYGDAIYYLQEASIKWPSDVRIAYNLSLCIDRYLADMVAKKSLPTEPWKIRELTCMCLQVTKTLQYLINLKAKWSVGVKSTTLQFAEKGYLSLKTLAPAFTYPHEACFPPVGIHSVPSNELLSQIMKRVEKELLPYFQKVPTAAENNFYAELYKREERRQHQEIKKKIIH